MEVGVKGLVMLLSFVISFMTDRAQIDIVRGDCKKFHEGYFSFEDSTLGNITLHRIKDTQIEYIGMGITATFLIKWEEECKYDLIFQETNRPDLLVGMHKNDTVKVKIIEIDGDSYKYISDSNGRIMYGRITKDNAVRFDKNKLKQR